MLEENSLMLNYKGIYLPDGEKHLPEWMDQANQWRDGKPCYQLHKYNAALNRISAEIESAQTKVARQSEQINEISREMEQYNQKVVDLKLQRTSLLARLENSDKTLKRLKEFLTDGNLRLEQLAEDIVRKDHKSNQSSERIGEFEKSLIGMYEGIKLLEQNLENN